MAPSTGMIHPRRVTLVPLHLTYIHDFMFWATDNAVTQYLLWSSYTSIEEAERFFTDVVAYHPWFKAICLDGRAVGSITLDQGKQAYRCKAELGYVLARKHWGKGIATQAIAKAIQSGFQDLDIIRIEAYVDPSNLASGRVLENNGFSQEGYLRSCILHKGQLRDRLLYALIRDKEKT